MAATSWALLVEASPSWYRSIRGLGMGRMNGGWSRVVGYVSVVGGSGARSPIWGISARRALWSLNSVGIAVVIVGGGCCASVGMRSS